MKRKMCIMGLAFFLAHGAVADEVFVATFDNGLDAAQSPATVQGAAKLAAERGGKVLDLGFGNAAAPAAVEYALPVRDVRSGTISFWIKTGFEWLKGAAVPEKKWDEHTFLTIPTEGGGHISVDWYNRFGAWFHVYLYDGENQMQFGLHERNPHVGDFNLAAGVWHHVVISWTPDHGRLVVDDKLVEERKLERPLNLKPALGTLILGSQKASPNAMLDDVRLSANAEFTAPVAATPAKAGEEPKVLAVGGPGTVQYANPRKTYQVPRLATPPTIDGEVSDPVWATVPAATGFVKLGLEHPFVDTQTSVRAAWDDQNLYLAITCYENAMARVKAEQHGKDAPVFGEDAIELFLGPWADKPKEYYQLALNSGDGWFDGKVFDAKWDGQWQRAVKRYADRWTVELAIPFATLGADVPKPGTVWRWNVARDRVAGGGIDGLSTLAEISSGWHAPDEFDKLEFVDPMADVAAAEHEANAAYVSATVSALQRKLADAEKELASSQRILARAGIADTTAGARTNIEARVATFQALLAKSSPALGDYNDVRLQFRDFDASLNAYAQAANKLGFVSAGNLPARSRRGVTKGKDYWYLASAELTAAIDPTTGILCGLYDRQRRAVVQWSYDLYVIETVKDTRKSDERLDEVSRIARDGQAIVVTCTNPQIPAMTITKRYSLAGEKMLRKEVTVQGKPGEKTLLSLVSRTQFADDFRQPAYYQRVKPTGTMGDPRAVFWARDIKEPVLLHFLFNVGAAANLCAVNPPRGEGVGQYWLTANGRWVLPCGYEGNKSFFTDSGWDLSWFVTFLSDTPQTGEMRYHLFAGDHTQFHQEYRDLPERQKVINAEPLSPQSQGQAYHLNLGPLEGASDFRNPRSQTGGPLRLLYPRLRSHEYASHYGVPQNDLRHGDYPVGDDAQLHFEFGENSKTYPAAKIKEGMVAGEKDYPRILSGWYHTPQNICYFSDLAREHPEWILRGKDGQPVPSGWSPFYGVGDFSPEFAAEIIRRLARQMDYFHMKLMYIDYSITGPWVDWGKGVVRHSAASYDFLNGLARAVHERGGILHVNSDTFDGVYDLGYWEGFSKYTGHGQHWRDVADAMMMRRLYERPGTRTIPIQWFGGDMFGDAINYRDYTDLCLSQLFMASNCLHDPYHIHFKDPATGDTDWAANYAHQVAYQDTTLEAAGATWTDLDLQPCWWREFDTNIEAYGFRKGGAHLLTVLSHEPLKSAPTNFTLSVSSKKLGLARDRATFIWEFRPRDPDKFPRRGGPQPENWDKLFTLRTCHVIPAGQVGDRLAIEIVQLEPQLTHLYAVTQVPAVFESLENRATNLLLPALLGNRLENTKRGLKATTVYPAEILVHDAAGEVAFGDVRFRRVTVPVGETLVPLK